MHTKATNAVGTTTTHNEAPYAEDVHDTRGGRNADAEEVP